MVETLTLSGVSPKSSLTPFTPSSNIGKGIQKLLCGQLKLPSNELDLLRGACGGFRTFLTGVRVCHMAGSKLSYMLSLADNVGWYPPSSLLSVWPPTKEVDSTKPTGSNSAELSGSSELKHRNIMERHGPLRCHYPKGQPTKPAPSTAMPPVPARLC